ncbi:MAG: hypothetical protein KGJ80_06150 [Chloroflexota bacterium]|nr:hypothetical protein [Chloroflexota bacterium]
MTYCSLSGMSHNAMEEWLDEKSIVPRVALLAKLMVKIAEEWHLGL